MYVQPNQTSDKIENQKEMIKAKNTKFVKKKKKIVRHCQTKAAHLCICENFGGARYRYHKHLSFSLITLY